MSSHYQLACTIASLIFNIVLIYLIVYESSKLIGKYKYLMIYTCVFEIAWGLFDLPADVNSFSYGYCFVVYRVNHSSAWLTDAQSTFVILIYTAFFAASLAIFGANFLYRYGQIDRKFGEIVTSGRKFYLLFIIPILYAVWWAVIVALFFGRTQETDDYSRKTLLENLHERIEDISYVSGLFYEPEDGTFKLTTWLGVANLATMVLVSMLCVCFFGYLCYRKLNKDLSKLTFVSSATANLQKQLFYSLVIQTTIPIVFIHTPMCIFLILPMLKSASDLASDCIIASITLYPAIDPLPSFFVIKSYRTAVTGKWDVRCPGKLLNLADFFEKYILRRPILHHKATPSTLPQPN